MNKNHLLWMVLAITAQANPNEITPRDFLLPEDTVMDHDPKKDNPTEADVSVSYHSMQPKKNSEKINIKKKAPLIKPHFAEDKSIDDESSDFFSVNSYEDSTTEETVKKMQKSIRKKQKLEDLRQTKKMLEENLKNIRNELKRHGLHKNLLSEDSSSEEYFDFS